MGADVSRARFDALRDHSGVVLQQGRLLLDADWNELVAVIDRRLRANAADLGSTGPKPGVAGVAVVPRTTPDAFRIDATAGALTIGIGRMYVDGLLAENHGLPDLAFEPLLDDRVGTKKTPYDKQPYWPTPAPLPTSGSHLAYLDVWDREVTPLEAPDLVEPAVGVDTTVRTQTVWQVRMLGASASGIDCSTPDADVPGWLDVVAPSAGRLTTGTVPVDDDDDPCALPPSGGYRGLENQTYRVEVHDGGAAGTATFKWSRDNGSVASPVVEVISSTRIRPASLGKDSVLRFRTGDWVEVLDDHRELDQRPGEMRRIEVHEEDGTISWVTPLPADLQMSGAQAAARHLRVRRWDQGGKVRTTTNATVVDLDLPAATGVIPVPANAATIVLEHGVTVQLKAPGGRFRAGDYWIFAARTADSSVEALTAAPPRGIHHHYARLAVVTFPGSETDCRTLWPPLSQGGGKSCGDCTVCVTPESHASGALTIQAAVDSVRDTGGTVCLAAGTYQLDADGVRIENARSVTVKGQGPATLLVARGTALEVATSLAVTLQDVAIVSAGSGPAVSVRATAGVTVQRLVILVAARDAAHAGIELSRVALRPVLRENVIVAPVGIGCGDVEKGALLTAALEIADNFVVAGDRGVALEGRVGHVLETVVRDNAVIRAPGGGILATGAVVAAGSLDVRANTLVVDGTGIAVGTSGASVRDNSVTGTPASLERRGGGVAVVRGELSPARGRVTVTGNDVRDVGGVGIAVRAPVGDLEVAGNEIRRAAAGIVMEERARAASAAVVHNVVRDVGSRQSDRLEGGCVGIQVVGVLRANVDGNVISGVGTSSEASDGATGVRMLAALDSRVAGNGVDTVGFAEQPGLGLGVHVAGHFGRTTVTGNSARRLLGDVDQTEGSNWTGLLIGAAVDRPRAAVAEVGPYVQVAGGFLLGGKAGYAMGTSGDVSAVVEGNTVTGGGEAPAAVIAVPGDVVVSANQFRNPRESARPALELVGESATVQGNRARGGEPSMDLRVDAKRVAVVANLVSTLVVVDGAPLGAPWDVLNPGGI